MGIFDLFQKQPKSKLQPAQTLIVIDCESLRGKEHEINLAKYENERPAVWLICRTIEEEKWAGVQRRFKNSVSFKQLPAYEKRPALFATYSALYELTKNPDAYERVVFVAGNTEFNGLTEFIKEKKEWRLIVDFILLENRRAAPPRREQRNGADRQRPPVSRDARTRNSAPDTRLANERPVASERRPRPYSSDRHAGRVEHPAFETHAPNPSPSRTDRFAARKSEDARPNEKTTPTPRTEHADRRSVRKERPENGFSTERRSDAYLPGERAASPERNQKNRRTERLPQSRTPNGVGRTPDNREAERRPIEETSNGGRSRETFPTREDVQTLVQYFERHFMQGEIYEKSRLGGLVKDATGRTVYEVFRTRNGRHFVNVLRYHRCLEEVDEERFRFLRFPSERTFRSTQQRRNGVKRRPSGDSQNNSELVAEESYRS